MSAGSRNDAPGHVSYRVHGHPRGAQLCGDWERPTLRAWRPIRRQNQHVLVLLYFAQALLRGDSGGAGEPHRCHQRGDVVVVLVMESPKEGTTVLEVLLPSGG